MRLETVLFSGISSACNLQFAACCASLVHALAAA
jgi:hypothetical protein